ncbi:MAG: sigma-E processing peptidase SpoIIGA [Clostridia bacterium]
MVHAEAYLVLNATLCVCALALGGKLAGLPLPKAVLLCMAALLNALLCAPALLWPSMGAIALAGLPLSVALCFGRHGGTACVRCFVTTLCATFLSGGTVQALTNVGMGAMPALLCSFSLSLLLYLLATLLPTSFCEVRQVEITMEAQHVLLPAMLDSGNLLRDPVTGLPVLVVPERALRPLFPDVKSLVDLRGLPLGFRLLNVHTAAGSALLPMFRPDACRLYLNGHAKATEILVAVAGREYGGVQALVPMSALPAGAAVQ